MGLLCFPEFNQQITLVFCVICPRIAPIAFRKIGEQNLVFLSEYCSRDSGLLLMSSKVDKERVFAGLAEDICRLIIY